MGRNRRQDRLRQRREGGSDEDAPLDAPAGQPTRTGRRRAGEGRLGRPATPAWQRALGARMFAIIALTVGVILAAVAMFFFDGEDSPPDADEPQSRAPAAVVMWHAASVEWAA